MARTILEPILFLFVSFVGKMWPMWSFKQSEIKDTWNPLMTLIGLVLGGWVPSKIRGHLGFQVITVTCNKKTLELLSGECKTIKIQWCENCVETKRMPFFTRPFQWLHAYKNTTAISTAQCCWGSLAHAMPAGDGRISETSTAHIFGDCLPKHSMHGIFTYIWSISMVNVVKLYHSLSVWALWVFFYASDWCYIRRDVGFCVSFFFAT